MGRNVKDITGMQFGYLTAVKFSHRKNGKTYWEFKCRCGNTVVRRVDKLKRCETPSCGCYSKEYCEYQKETAQKRRNIKNKIKIAQKEKKHRETLAWRDLTGETIGNLTVLEMLGEQCGKRTMYKCLCDCGNEVNKSQGQLTTKSPCNSTWSCGCTKERHSNSEYANQNNLTTSRIYRIYKNMINRCYNSRNTGYKDYGARGITVCEEWLQGDGFEAFYHFFNPGAMAPACLFIIFFYHFDKFITSAFNHFIKSFLCGCFCFVCLHYVASSFFFYIAF